MLVQEVLAVLAEHGFDDVVPVLHTEERLSFALPRELRAALA